MFLGILSSSSLLFLTSQQLAGSQKRPSLTDHVLLLLLIQPPPPNIWLLEIHGIVKFLVVLQARLNQDEQHFLVNPFGMLYHEITASSLVKIDIQGKVVEQGTTNFGINVAGFMLHAAIHAARPDVKCIIHIHTPSVLAVSCVYVVL